MAMELTGHADAVISSPPYATMIRGNENDDKTRKRKAERLARGEFTGKCLSKYTSKNAISARGMFEGTYGNTEGNLSRMMEGEAMGKMKLEIMATDVWTGCYDDQWKGIITPESFAHPAKMALCLIKRTLKHLREEGRLKKGQLIVDPFGGVATCGIVAASRDYRWAGVELEPRFVAMAEANFDLHRRKWSKELWPKIIQGDSRNLAALLREADVILGGPPHENSMHLNESPEKDEARRRKKDIGDDRWKGPQKDANQGYGASEGQLGNEEGQTFWGAAKVIVQQCFQILKPGGSAVWVVKDFIRNKARVPFSDDWLRLCLACGFRLACRHRAMLVKSVTVPTLFGDEERKTERKSFFRRLAENKMDKYDPRRIDWEDVICVEKPME